MASLREAIKCSLLQLKTTKRTGTLRKKTKLVYGEPSWVVLCVHDDRIPFLEWYHTEESIRAHRPVKVLDLLFATYVNSVVADPRAFVIGVQDVEPVELVALQQQTCAEWVQTTVETLRRLAILPGASNIYEAGSEVKIETQTPMELPAPILSPLRSRGSRHISTNSHVSFSGSCGREQRPQCLRPPLPPRRNLEAYFPIRTGSCDDIIAHNEAFQALLSPNDDQLETPQQNSPIYDRPRNEFLSGVATPPRSPRPRNGIIGKDTTRSHDTLYVTLSPAASRSNNSVSPMQSTVSTNSLCSSLSSELRLSTVLPTLESGDYDLLRTDYNHNVKYVSLNLSILVEHMMFVEVSGRVWVAGWSITQEKHLATTLSFGDELIEVEGRPVTGINDIPQLFYNCSTPGAPIALAFRTIPFGCAITLVKPIRKCKDIGIVLHKRKNRIAEIATDSSAARRGLPANLPSAFCPDKTSASVITDVADKRLNPFAKNDQFYNRFDEIRDGTEFKITIHPHDFVKEMKQHILNVKHYKMYLPTL